MRHDQLLSYQPESNLRASHSRKRASHAGRYMNMRNEQLLFARLPKGHPSTDRKFLFTVALGEGVIYLACSSLLSHLTESSAFFS